MHPAMLPLSCSLTGTNSGTALSTLGSLSILLEPQHADTFHTIVLSKFKSVHVGFAHCLDRHLHERKDVRTL